MSDNFFYDLNKRLQQVADTPKSEHKQLNERDEGKHNNAVTGFKAVAAKAAKEYGSKAAGERVAGAVRNKMKKAGKLEEQDMDEGMFDSLKAGMAKAGKVAKKVGGKALDTLGHPDDDQLLKNFQKKIGAPVVGKKKSMGEEYGPMEGGAPMTPKQKKFAKLAPPADKITFADKIAGAKKEVDEMLGDVAAEAMRGALKGGQKKLDKNHNGKLDANDFAMLRAGKGKQETDEGWDDMIKDVDRRRSAMKTGEKIRGHKGEIEKTATGIKHTRNYDPKTGETDTDDGEGQAVKKGRGRPKGSGKAIGAKGPSGTSKLMKRESEQELDEKAVSKKQQKFMGMVHAAQKGEKPASKEVAKVAKTMKKKDAEDFAATKHKGLPEKVKSKKKEKTEEAGGVDTPTASSGFSFGKGIYDSLNREIENIIAESMSINASDSTEGGKSLTITATDEDAMKLASMMRNAGIGGAGAPESGEVEVVGVDSPISGDEGHMHDDGACETCGSADCGCGDIEEALDENNPDWPTETEVSDDPFQYSGGLNKPKTDVAGDGQTTVPNTAVHTQDEDELRRLREMAGIAVQEQEQVVAVESADEELEESADEELEETVEESLARMRGLAGIKEAAKPDYVDLDKDGDKEESMKKAADDKEKDKKVEESIFRMTNLWKAYKG